MIKKHSPKNGGNPVSIRKGTEIKYTNHCFDGQCILDLVRFIHFMQYIYMFIVDRPATPNFRFNQPANNMDNFPKNSLFGS